MDLLEFTYLFETHDVEGVKKAFAEGVDANAIFRGEPLFNALISMYTRGPGFKQIVRAFVDKGLQFEDPILLALLLDDAESLDRQLIADPAWVHKTYKLRCTYAPLEQVSMLHIAAEYNHVACAEVLLKHGADVNARAGLDAYGFGGQTPIFHTVNQNYNRSKEMMHFLLENGADLGYTVKGIIWGKGFDWETLTPSVNPISYAMMGLLPQFHRKEEVISETVSTLLKHAYGIEYTARNVPNKYLQS